LLTEAADLPLSTLTLLVGWREGHPVCNRSFSNSHRWTFGEWCL